ncbi:MAG: hypothetical protein R3Y50_06085 [Rikenellaceae bacterium]
MKRHVQSLGVRKWSGDDLLDLQGEGLKISDGFFSQFGNCAITGVKVTENSVSDEVSYTISEGLVSIDGMVLPFAGATEVELFPVYLKKSETHATREYADGVVRDISIAYYAELVAAEPEDESYLKITADGTARFFEKEWFDDIDTNLTTLKNKDSLIMALLQQITIPTLSSEPTSTTLTYQIDDVTYNFVIGQQCRVLNSESGDYTFYYVADIISDTVVWKTVGSGDGGAYAAPTLDEIPGEDTLTYTADGVTKTFLIGQQCRYYDTENEKYVFYQLYDIDSDDKADWQIAGSDGSAFEEQISITLVSNQGANDTSLDDKIVTITWDGQDEPLELTWSGSLLKATIPMSVQYTVTPPTISGYTSAEAQSFMAIGANKRQVDFTYSCEKVTVNVTADNEADTSGRTVTVKHTTTDAVLGSGTGSEVVVRVPTGTPYTVSADSWDTYIAPSSQSFTANQATRIISFEYEKITNGTITFDNSISDPANISGDINDGVIATILSKFRRCLCKKTADGAVTIRYLKDADSTKYDDGTTAVLSGTEGDVMVNFPEFYYKYNSISSSEFSYSFAEFNVDGAYIHVPHSLVGAYKGYISNNKLYSRSGVEPTKGEIFTECETYASNRGNGYQQIDFQQHCIIAFMLYAKYGNRNIQDILGAGGVAYDETATGTTNLTGNADTENENASGKYVCGLGVEGVFGGFAEWVSGISITDYIWEITDPDGTTRNITAPSSGGWVKNVAAENGTYFDLVPTACDGSSTTYYAGSYSCGAGGPVYMRRADDGVASSGARPLWADLVFTIGSRIAFRGEITEAPSVAAFKALEVL